MEPGLHCRGREWKGPSRADGKSVLIKAQGFGTASQAPGAHEHQFAPAKCPFAHPALRGVSPGELRKVLVGAKNLMFKGWGGKEGGKNPEVFFTSCCIMNSPFQGMCEFLLGLGERCKMFSAHVCPSFQTNGFLCVCCLLLSAFPNHLWDLVLPGKGW